MTIKSLDPRIDRQNISVSETFNMPSAMDQWQTFEVFHQTKRGQQHQHVGIVHAPNPELAILFAKEQYARRGETINIWVVKSAEIYTTDYDDADIFSTVPEKQFREPGMYKVMDKISAYKKSQLNEK